MPRIVGIDLGTTNSVVAFVEGDRVETIPNREGKKTTPSVVLYKQDERVVGELAKRQHAANPGITVRSVKRLMGKRFEDVQSALQEFPFKVAPGDDGVAVVALGDGTSKLPEEVSADVLSALREMAEDYLNDTVDQAVITVPAHFNDQQRTATKRAAEYAGLEVLRIINEPTAAALAYGLGKEKDERIAVFDFGGGTFDVSILQLHGDIYEVLATGGDNHLGGDNIDEILYNHICNEILQQTGLDPRRDISAIQRIREAAERAKCELSTLQSTTLALPFIVADQAKGPRHYESKLTRERFSLMTEELMQRLLPPCRQALEDAGLKTTDLSNVVLVGGSTRIPRVQELVRQFFGREPNKTVNPDEAVAIGAAIQAGVMRGELAEVLLLDVTPLSLGIELAGGVFKSLIPRNSTIPCEATRRFTTVVDNQTSVLVHVLQGERKIASENHSLAKFRLTGIPPAPKELPEIEVRFTIDANGILQVSAMDLSSGQETYVVVEGYGQMAPQNKETITEIVSEAAKHTLEDEAFVRQNARRQTVLHLQDKVQKLLDEVGDVIPEEDLKTAKETQFRLDLALREMDEFRMDTLMEQLEQIVARYRGAREMHKALNKHYESFGPPGTTGGASGDRGRIFVPGTGQPKAPPPGSATHGDDDDTFDLMNAPPPPPKA